MALPQQGVSSRANGFTQNGHFQICQKQKLLPAKKNHYLAHVAEKNNYRLARREATTNAGLQLLIGQECNRSSVLSPGDSWESCRNRTGRFERTRTR
jgi:hypothetical protein